MTKVFTNGVFDLFHEGHYKFLEKASREGEYLIVGVASDESCARSKRQPFQPWSLRAETIRRLPFVDEVIATGWSIDFPDNFFDVHGISLQVQGDHGSKFPLAEKLGRLKILGRTPNISTTKLLSILNSAHSTTLNGGELNDVRKVYFENEYFVVKSGERNVAKKFPMQLPDTRIRNEYEIIMAFRSLLPDPHFITQPLCCDQVSTIIFLSAPETAISLLDRCMNSPHDETLSALILDIARKLGAMHSATYRNTDLAAKFSDTEPFKQIKVGVQCLEASKSPELTKRIAAFMEKSLRIHDVLLHGDFAPKNILCWGRNVLFIDFEESAFGDPALDIGYLLAHLRLHQILGGEALWDTTIREAEKAYLDTYVGAAADAGLKERIRRYAGIFMISRVDSRAPASYIRDDNKAKVLEEGTRLLVD